MSEMMEPMTHLLDALARVAALGRPLNLRLRLEGAAVAVRVRPAGADAGALAPLLGAPPAGAMSGRPPEWASGPLPKHLHEFRKVYWPGRGVFVLGPKQAAVVRLLWKAYEAGVFEVGQEKLLRAADSDSGRLARLFERSPAYGDEALIIKGELGGNYRLPPLPQAATAEGGAA